MLQTILAIQTGISTVQSRTALRDCATYFEKTEHLFRSTTFCAGRLKSDKYPLERTQLMTSNSSSRT